ncbi:hypothetical protein IEE_05051 [Bacillus cereus BAG5X1-1]|uniref:Carrier domain-containing protein n=1 Tax=Bacillus cereus BAG5X1-1 TaxID=1053189 RepID=J8AFZ8_BACCE|nr:MULTISPECIES: acyl carrier protein [Bacillus cereus group]EJQ38410.1 hypothetical protein IEE_05051 [Bacillus cereus BAG5X1-1]PEU20471.1 poly(3-hydroxyalkanoate) depolymerase [Bacillus wiedmannii]
MKKEDIFELITQKAIEVIPELENYSFKPNDQLADLGANSVDRAEIVMLLLESLSLQIPRIELFGVKNIGELADVLYEKLQSA